MFMYNIVYNSMFIYNIMYNILLFDCNNYEFSKVNSVNANVFE